MSWFSNMAMKIPLIDFYQKNGRKLGFRVKIQELILEEGECFLCIVFSTLFITTKTIFSKLEMTILPLSSLQSLASTLLTI